MGGRGLIVAATVVAALVPLGTALVAAPARSAPVAAELLPDLVTYPPGPLELERRGRRVRLRLGNVVGNVGRGPVELAPQRGDCDRDGDAADDRQAYQRVYLDANGDGRFTPRRDRRVRRHRGACTRFHPRHQHWHYDDFSRYELRRPAGGAVVRASAKVSFCLMDVLQPLGPARRAAEPLYVLCGRDEPQGISVGWADEYGEYLPGQHVDVTGVAPGLYCLVSTADPANTIVESNDGNNAAVTALVLGPRRVRTSTSRACAGLVPPV